MRVCDPREATGSACGQKIVSAARSVARSFLLDDERGASLQAAWVQQPQRPDDIRASTRIASLPPFAELKISKMAVALSGSKAVAPLTKKESRHFQSLQIFTTHAEPGLDEFLTRKEQIELEHKHRDEEDKLYR